MSRLKNSDIQLIKTVCELQGRASTLCILEALKVETGKQLSIGSLHYSLIRLVNRGLIDSEKAEATAERGGRRKRVFHVTAYGYKSLNQEAL